MARLFLQRVLSILPVPILAFSFGCGAGEDNGKPADPGVGEAEFRGFLARYGNLETLAGAGVKGGDTNDWDAVFEGGPAPRADLSTPHNALGDADGNTFIADKDANAIRKVSPDGTLTTVAGVNIPGDDGDEPAPGMRSHLRLPNGIWVKPDGTVYILDLGNQKVRKLDPAGELTTLFQVPGLAAGRGLWVSDDERLSYVCSGTVVKRWDPQHGIQDFATGFAELGNLAVASDGTVFVTDRGRNRVLRLVPGADPVPVAGDGSSHAAVDGELALKTGIDEVRGIWIADTGGLLLATHRGSQVFYLDTEGFLHLLVDGAPNAHAGDGEPVSTPGKKVSEVRNVTINPQGEILITENDLGYIRVVRRR